MAKSPKERQIQGSVELRILEIETVLVLVHDHNMETHGFQVLLHAVTMKIIISPILTLHLMTDPAIAIIEATGIGVLKETGRKDTETATGIEKETEIGRGTTATRGHPNATGHDMNQIGPGIASQ